MASFAAIDLGEGVWSAPDRRLATGYQAISFGSFRLLPKQQLLLEADKPVRLGSRALEILTALVERAGEMVTKEEIIARALVARPQWTKWWGSNRCRMSRG
jgi:hypothetical protein